MLFRSQASTFIQTWKCHEITALSNVLAFSQYRKDVCENGDRRWIFARNDAHQFIVVDLKEKRWVSEMGVDFGDAGERLPKSVTFSYLPTSASKVDPNAFEHFGSVNGGISDYTLVKRTTGVSTRYVMYEFDAGSSATAFMQLVAAGPESEESPNAGYIALLTIIIVSLLAEIGRAHV